MSVSKFMAAARTCDTFRMRTALDAGSDVEERDGESRTALHIAARVGDAAAVSMLLRAGAYMEATASSGVTPLMFACTHDDNVCTTRLLDAGARADVVDRAGRTALFYAIRAYSCSARTLIQRGARLDVADALGDTPLHAAARAENIEAALEMFAAAARGAHVDVNAVNEDGDTPLHIFMRVCCEEDVQSVLLHAQGLRVNIVNKNGCTVLDEFEGGAGVAFMLGRACAAGELHDGVPSHLWRRTLG